MPCYHPLLATMGESPDGRKIWVHGAYDKHLDLVNDSSVLLPCGQCIFCRLRRSLEWTIRCYHEQSLSRCPGSFLSLTFNEQTVPKLADGKLTLDHRPFQLFMKRLRKFFPGRTFRYLMCGEYGSRTHRPHYHCMLFGFTFEDQYKFKYVDDGDYWLYRSPTLEKIWTDGISTIGELNHATMNYVCRYNLKKVTGRLADQFYQGRRPEYINMSRRPGIGSDWLSRFHGDVYAVDEIAEMVLKDRVRYNGHICKPPRFYDKRFGFDFPTQFDIVKMARESFAKSLDMPTVDSLNKQEEAAHYKARQALFEKSQRKPKCLEL